MSEISPHEQRRFTDIATALHLEHPDLFFYGEPPPWNVKARIREVARRGVKIMAIGALVTIFGGGTASILLQHEDDATHKRMATDAVLHSGALLAQLKICRYELEAQAALLESQSSSAQPNAEQWRLAAQNASQDYGICDSGGKIMMKTTVSIGADDTYTISSTDITSFEVSTWCNIRSQYAQARDYQSTRLQAGDDMMQRAGHPC
jgi:hypothetical protein